MDMGLVIVGAICMGIFLWIKDSNLKVKKDSLESSINEIDNFTATQYYLAEDGTKGIAFDESKNKLAICSSVRENATTIAFNYNFPSVNENQQKLACTLDEKQKKSTNTPVRKNTSAKVFNYQDILSAEIFYDGDTVTKTNRVSQIGGALVGGLALGGLGAVVGGLSGKTSSKKEVEKIELRIVVNDKKYPIQDIIFLNTKCKEWSPLYKESERLVRHWYAIISLLIKEADKEDKKNISQSTTPNIDKSSLVETLEELNVLFQKGILTEDEFAKAKQKALNEV